MKDPAWTPCIGKCTPDTPDGGCRGCGRTAAEIRDWNTYSREKKIEINERLKNEFNQKVQNIG